jgi:DNA invertase Pin-like site-specific DNA recombinase
VNERARLLERCLRLEAENGDLRAALIRTTRKRRRVDPTVDAQIAALRERGMSFDRIAKLLDYPRTTIYNRWRRIRE